MDDETRSMIVGLRTLSDRQIEVNAHLASAAAQRAEAEVEAKAWRRVADLLAVESMRRAEVLASLDAHFAV